jgi:choline-sulfatase
MRKIIIGGSLLALTCAVALGLVFAKQRRESSSGVRLIDALVDAIDIPQPPAEKTIYALQALPQIPAGATLAVPFRAEAHRAFVVRLRLEASAPAVATLRALDASGQDRFENAPRLLTDPALGTELGPCDQVSVAGDTRIYQRFDHLPDNAAAALLVIRAVSPTHGSVEVFDADMPDPDAPRNPIIARLVRRSPNLTSSGTSWRSSLVARHEGRYVFELALKEGTTLELGTGHEPGVRGSPVRFRVLQDERVLLDEVVANDRRWHDHRLILSGKAGVKTRIALVSEAVQDPESARGLWSNPRIFFPSKAPNILLVTCDAVRPDHLSAYGYERDTTPALAAATHFGARFDRATAQAPRTWESLTALFTGRYPARNGVRHRGQALPSDVPHLAQVLSNHGYETFAGTDLANFPPSYLSRFDEAEIAASGEKISPQKQFKRIVQSFSAHPVFAWFHLENAHYPLVPKEPLRFQRHPGPVRHGFTLEDHARFSRPEDLSPLEVEQVTALYDSAIRDVDEEIAGLLTTLNQNDLLDRTIVVITADHGEQIAQHGLALEHLGPYDEVLHVPLIVLWPEHLVPGTRIRARVQLIDLAPTLLSLVGLPVPPGLDGRDLSAALRGEEIVDAPAYAELAGKVFVQYRDQEQLLFSPGGAFIQLPSGVRSSFGEVEVYDLSHDPGETHNLVDQDPSRTQAALGAIKLRLQEWNRQRQPTSSEQIGPAAYEVLRQAGYLQNRHPQGAADLVHR